MFIWKLSYCFNKWKTFNKVKVNLVRIESDKLKPNQITKKLKNVSGLLIPGGFGKRGTEGKISAIKYARERKIPFLGICFGMQMAIIEFARNKLKIKKAGSTELDKKCYPVIGLINDENKGCGNKGLDLNSGWNWTPINHGWFFQFNNFR